jgi:hypothetical protein
MTPCEGWCSVGETLCPHLTAVTSVHAAPGSWIINTVCFEVTGSVPPPHQAHCCLQMFEFLKDIQIPDTAVFQDRCEKIGFLFSSIDY